MGSHACIEICQSPREGEGWFIVNGEFEYLWAEDLKWHSSRVISDIPELYHKIFYKTKEEAQDTLNKWEKAYP